MDSHTRNDTTSRVPYLFVEKIIAAYFIVPMYFISQIPNIKI